MDSKLWREALEAEQSQRDEIIAWRNRFPQYWYRRDVGKVAMHPEYCTHSAAKAVAISRGLDSYVCDCGVEISAQTQGTEQ